jgi:PAS domain-containing protein
MGSEASCRRCPPVRRGRKRRASAVGNSVVDNVMSNVHAALEQLGAAKRLKGANGEVDHTQKEAVELFASLLTQFRTWRNELPSLMQGDATAVSRFMYFCSFVSHMVTEYMRGLPSDSHESVSIWLCSHLGKEVNDVIAANEREAVAFDAYCRRGKTASISEQERQVYKMMPVAVAVQPLFPRLFHPGTQAWVNDKMSSMLGYSSEELSAILSDPVRIKRVLPHHQFVAALAQLWNAIAHKRESYTTTTEWLDRDGDVIETTETRNITYDNGMPTMTTIYVQVSPDCVKQNPRPATASASATLSIKQESAAPVAAPAAAPEDGAERKGTAGSPSSLTPSDSPGQMGGADPLLDSMLFGGFGGRPDTQLEMLDLQYAHSLMMKDEEPLEDETPHIPTGDFIADKSFF